MDSKPNDELALSSLEHLNGNSKRNDELALYTVQQQDDIMKDKLVTVALAIFKTFKGDIKDFSDYNLIKNHGLSNLV